MTNATKTECAYCNHIVTDGETPSTHDDAAWVEAAKEHAKHCEWIETRAHTRDAA